MYRVEWLAIGETQVPESVTYHLGRSDILRPVIAYAFLLTSRDGGRHLIDTGVRSPEEINAGRPIERHWHVASAGSLAQQLKVRGIDPETVATVLLTHLHYDHCSQLGLFPNAEIIISRAEWMSVVAPVHKDMLRFTRYPRDVYADLVDQSWERLRLIDDDEDVLPGIRAWVLGGHTPGSTAYLVGTDSGDLAISGDFLNTFANWEQRIPSGLLVSLEQWFRGYERLKGERIAVIPSHDPNLAVTYPGGLIATLGRDNV